RCSGRRRGLSCSAECLTLYTPTGPLGRSVASVDLKQPSMHRRSSICPLRCARDPVTSSFSGVACHFCGPPTSPETEYRGFGRPIPPPGGGAAARFAMMSSVEMAATEFNDSVGRSVAPSACRSRDRAGHAGKKFIISMRPRKVQRIGTVARS
ncbi:hypothetical protein THAOC_30596, partial [Thalassiosira oceanica]